MLEKVDHSALKVSQVAIVILNITAFVLNIHLLALFVILVMAVGVALRMPGFGFIYRYALKPLGWIKPEILLDNPEPHRFAQGFGVVVMAVGWIALVFGSPVVGWSLVWLVAGLAALNAFGGFCVGCAVYYWLNRLHVPGFHKSPPAGTFPGMRPRGVKL